jgi:hypothetical protein
VDVASTLYERHGWDIHALWRPRQWDRSVRILTLGEPLVFGLL